MIHFILYVSLSALETNMTFLLMLSLFRYKADPKMPLLTLFSVLLACMSYYLRAHANAYAVDTPLQLALTYAFVKYAFALPWFYAGVMMLSGTTLYMLVQSGMTITFHQLGWYVLEDSVRATGFNIYCIQVLSALIGYAIVLLMRRANLGFTFIPSHGRTPVDINEGHNRRLLYSMTVTTIVFVVSICAFPLRSQVLLYMALPLLLLAYAYFVTVSMEKETSEEL
ncbi:hypothetical protein O9H85_14130 [Paenibacillus filicis]|uniref:Histidine kinase n=1 Tax=Paenibacillus gyeongsangnamensis TaxID=3388067 RepID=A0ABT4Q9J6_9BACL|nr:hypothetical protein [Paenibacillus filicis]MCZ8513551.1 hypothetical protein [Paenibacillus filicis]